MRYDALVALFTLMTNIEQSLEVLDVCLHILYLDLELLDRGLHHRRDLLVLAVQVVQPQDVVVSLRRRRLEVAGEVIQTTRDPRHQAVHAEHPPGEPGEQYDDKTAEYL